MQARIRNDLLVLSRDVRSVHNGKEEFVTDFASKSLSKNVRSLNESRFDFDESECFSSPPLRDGLYSLPNLLFDGCREINA
jgi:hypothetical protein